VKGVWKDDLMGTSFKTCGMSVSQKLETEGALEVLSWQQCEVATGCINKSRRAKVREVIISATHHTSPDLFSTWRDKAR
jgi:hypothetical protein